MLEAVRSYILRVETDVLRLNTGDHVKKSELREFLHDLASTTTELIVEEEKLQHPTGPLTFQVKARTKNSEGYHSREYPQRTLSSTP